MIDFGKIGVGFSEVAAASGQYTNKNGASGARGGRGPAISFVDGQLSPLNAVQRSINFNSNAKESTGVRMVADGKEANETLSCNRSNKIRRNIVGIN